MIFLNFKPIKLISVTLIVLFLSSCGGGSGGADVSDANANITSTEYAGVAQKGPFENNSVITASRITSTGDLTGNLLKANVNGNSGNYKINLPSNWGAIDSAIQMSAEGFFVNELDGSKSSNSIELTSIINDKLLLSINLLTDWTAKRTKFLLKNGKSLGSAKEQSEKELSKAFGINNIHELDIMRADKLFSDNAQLLLLSGALMELANKRNINAQVIIDEIGNDFAKNGQLNQTGDDWFIRLQAIVRDNPAAHVDQYAKALKDSLGLNSPTGRLLPIIITLASRPVASLPDVIFAAPGETILLDGSESHAEDGIANFTWFRVDQKDFTIPFLLVDGEGGISETNARFADAPSITVPNEETELLFALVVTDNNDLTHTKVVKVVVKEPPPENHAPVAKGQDLETNEDVPLVIILTGEDSDGDVIDFEIDTPLLLAHGLLEGVAPNLTYTPDLNFHGADSFDFSVNDGNESSEPATINIQVNPVNDPPIANGQTKTVNEDETLPLLLTGFDVDGDTLSFSNTDVSHGTLSGTGNNLTYTPESNYNGPDSFTFTVNDGLLGSSVATVNIVVNPVNDPPEAFPDDVITDEDISIEITLVAEDIDEDVLHFEIDSGPTEGTLSGLPLVDGQPAVLTYTPNLNYFGPDEFTFVVTDPDGETSTATISIEINPINDPPVAVDYTCTLNPSATLSSITISDFEFPDDPEGDTIGEYIINGTLNNSLWLLLEEDNNDPAPYFLNDGVLIAEPETSAVPGSETSFEYIVKDIVNDLESEPATIKVKLP